MRLVSDVHGASAALRRIAAEPGPLLVLGDLINFIDYRTLDGIVADVSGRSFVAEMVRLRAAADHAGASRLWSRSQQGQEDEVRARYLAAIEEAYAEVCAALAGAEAYVTFGNVDRPDLLQRHLPDGVTFVESGVFEIEGWRVGIVGGGTVSIGTPGEITEAQMAERLAALGPVDMLCTHAPPAIGPLARDVVGGREKGSSAIVAYLERMSPRFHYFGDIHQPQATSWRFGATRCRNVGYFRATGRALHHG
ncbi:MAG: metallophosphoesterase [Acidimicrobiia bacterium]|jgi:Icc-related predicted phosphoesterase